MSPTFNMGAGVSDIIQGHEHMVKVKVTNIRYGDRVLSQHGCSRPPAASTTEVADGPVLGILNPTRISFVCTRRRDILGVELKQDFGKVETYSKEIAGSSGSQQERLSNLQLSVLNPSTRRAGWTDQGRFRIKAQRNILGVELKLSHHCRSSERGVCSGPCEGPYTTHTVAAVVSLCGLRKFPSPDRKEHISPEVRTPCTSRRNCAFKVKKRGSDTGDTNTHAQCLIAPARKACNSLLHAGSKLSRVFYALCLPRPPRVGVGRVQRASLASRLRWSRDAVQHSFIRDHWHIARTSFKTIHRLAAAAITKLLPFTFTRTRGMRNSERVKAVHGKIEDRNHAVRCVLMWIGRRPTPLAWGRYRPCERPLSSHLVIIIEPRLGTANPSRLSVFKLPWLGTVRSLAYTVDDSVLPDVAVNASTFLVGYYKNARDNDLGDVAFDNLQVCRRKLRRGEKLAFRASAGAACRCEWRSKNAFRGGPSARSCRAPAPFRSVDMAARTVHFKASYNFSEALVKFYSQDIPPPRANKVNSLQIYLFLHLYVVPDDVACRRIFLGDLPFPPLLHSGAAALSPHFALIGSHDLVRLAHSLPTKANRVQSPAGSPDFRMWESCRTNPLVGGFYRGSTVSPAPSFRYCSILTSVTLIGSQDFAVRSRPHLFIH
ncbi:hypothetical protein PR048_031477 [Dryococelus australis]|uniref:DNA-directed RNA polymerase n=1 Tax=Dryococelus australis TaxID=614101 RepID=A0ABQ9G9F3_9NEOP|nr:hypothetical protein PR048_031477 [Dryococelus australis]